ncbi:MAG: hypothetical protein ACOX9R_06360, partial [Armatimonadota bacterium]
ELVVYWRDRYAILLPSELFEVVFDNLQRWQANKRRLLEAMRHTKLKPMLLIPEVEPVAWIGDW